jgi:hypothetical protein
MRGMLVVLGVLAAVTFVPVPATADDERASQQAVGRQQAPASVPGIEVPPPGVTQELRLRDGSVLYGRIEEVTEYTVVFRTLSGATTSIMKDDVASVRVLRGRVDRDRYFPPDPNATRLFFAPTARSLPRGQAYLGVYEFVMPFAQVGLTDRLSFGGGTPLIFGLGSNHPVWITPKVQAFAGDRVQAAAGLIHFANVDDGQFGIGYGVATIGRPDHALTVGIGWGYWRGTDSDRADTAIAMVGGEHRVSPRIKVITENYVMNGGGIASAGVRFIGDRLSADLGIAVALGADGFFAFPVVNFVWVF